MKTCLGAEPRRAVCWYIQWYLALGAQDTWLSGFYWSPLLLASAGRVAGQHSARWPKGAAAAAELGCPAPHPQARPCPRHGHNPQGAWEPRAQGPAALWRQLWHSNCARPFHSSQTNPEVQPGQGLVTLNQLHSTYRRSQCLNQSRTAGPMGRGWSGSQEYLVPSVLWELSCQCSNASCCFTYE